MNKLEERIRLRISVIEEMLKTERNIDRIRADRAEIARLRRQLSESSFT